MPISNPVSCQVAIDPPARAYQDLRALESKITARYGELYQGAECISQSCTISTHAFVYIPTYLKYQHEARRL